MSRAGNLITDGGQPALRFERRYRHPMERVWRAVTDPGEMAQWFPAAVVGERAEGADLVFDDSSQRESALEAGEPTRAEGPMFRGRVLEWQPPTRFRFTWGGEELRIELAPDGDGTHLVFTHVLSHESVAARNGAGWHHCLLALDGLLDGTDVPEAWEPDYDEYLDRMGPPVGEVDGDAVTWERYTHVDRSKVDHAVTDAGERAAWGAPAKADDAESWQIEPHAEGTRYRLTVTGAAGDADTAAAWHARLLQLDMYLAADTLIPSDPARWQQRYEAVLAE